MAEKVIDMRDGDIYHKGGRVMCDCGAMVVGTCYSCRQQSLIIDLKSQLAARDAELAELREAVRVATEHFRAASRVWGGTKWHYPHLEKLLADKATLEAQLAEANEAVRVATEHFRAASALESWGPTNGSIRDDMESHSAATKKAEQAWQAFRDHYAARASVEKANKSN